MCVFSLCQSSRCRIYSVASKTDSHEMVCSVSGLVAHADGATIDHCSNDGEIIVDIGEHSDLTDVWVSGLVGRSRSVYEKGGSLISSVNEGTSRFRMPKVIYLWEDFRAIIHFV